MKMDKNKMRIEVSLLVVFLLIFVLVGCSATKPSTPAMTPNPEKPQTTKPKTAEPIQTLQKVYSETFKDEDGTVLLEAKIISPEIKNLGNSNGISLINSYYVTQFDDFISSILADGLEKAREDKVSAHKNNYPFYPHTYERSFNITYNGNNLLSVLSEQYENTGGAHPNTIWISQTFDVQDGKKLALSDLLGGSKEQALEKVYETVLAQIKEKEGTDQFVWNENYQEDIRKYYSEDDFVLTEESLIIYYQNYAIAPYVAGCQKFEIPLGKVERLAHNVPNLPSNQLEEDLYTQANMLIDRNKTAFFEIFGLSMLNMKIPESGVGTETIFPVVDERFTTFAQLEEYVNSTYARSEADALLGNGRYLNMNGNLYGDISKDGGMGYYVDWESYRLEVRDITDRSATLMIYTIDDSPAGKEDITITVKMVKENGLWLLEQMVQ